MIMLHKKMNKNCVFMFFLGIPPPFFLAGLGHPLNAHASLTLNMY